MKTILRSFIISLAAPYIVYLLIPAVSIGTDPKNPLIIAGAFLLASQVANPFFSIILLPINILTHGLVTLVVNIALIFAFLNFLPGFFIAPYHFPGLNIQGIIIPASNFNSFETLFIVAFAITLIKKVLGIIFE